MIKKISSRIMRCVAGSRNANGLKRSYQNKVYKMLQKNQWNSLEENLRIQKEDLYALVTFALTEVPYYRQLSINTEDFSPDTIYDDIRKLPVLTKDIIRKQGELLFPDCKIRDWTYDNTSGGTTGEPVMFRQSGKFFDADQGGKMLFDEWAGRKPGESQIRLWGSERDILSGKKDWMNKAYRWCKNEAFLNSFRMSDAVLDKYVDEINVKKPRMILAYVQSARELARYVERNGKNIWSPCGIMTSAGTLDRDTHDLLSRVFKCPVLNRYGSREAGDMACSCAKNDGLHINMNAAYLEILDDAGLPCKQGDVGNIVVTSLTNYAMPLIRYQIGDRGAMSGVMCSCGRGWPLLKSVNGRTVDVFLTPDGSKVDGEYFTHLFYGEHNVKQFQIVQDKLNHLVISLVFYDKDNVEEQFYMNLKKEISKVMGESIQIEYKSVDYIPEEKSGKRAYTISLLEETHEKN